MSLARTIILFYPSRDPERSHLSRKREHIDRSLNIVLFGELYTNTTQRFSQWAVRVFSAKDPVETKLLLLITRERFSLDL